jgi:MFS family permease
MYTAEAKDTRNLFRSFKFTVLFLTGVVATFPLFVPPFFLPLYSTSLGLSPSAGAGLVAGFNFSSAVGRLACGFASDRFGPLNTLLMSLLLSSLSMLVLWPVSTTLGPLIAFVIINGTGNGGFFSTIPTVVGRVFGSARVSVAMGMMVTGWAGGYLMVSGILITVIANKLTKTGGANCRISPCCIRRGTQYIESVPPSNLLCWFHGVWCDDFGSYSAA